MPTALVIFTKITAVTPGVGYPARSILNTGPYGVDPLARSFFSSDDVYFYVIPELVCVLFVTYS